MQIRFDMDRDGFKAYVLANFPETKLVANDAFPEARRETEAFMDKFVKRGDAIKVLRSVDTDWEGNKPWVIMGPHGIATTLGVKNISQWVKDSLRSDGSISTHRTTLYAQHDCGLIFQRDFFFHDIKSVAILAARSKSEAGERLVEVLLHSAQAMLDKEVGAETFVRGHQIFKFGDPNFGAASYIQHTMRMMRPNALPDELLSIHDVSVDFT